MKNAYTDAMQEKALLDFNVDMQPENMLLTNARRCRRVPRAVAMYTAAVSLVTVLSNTRLLLIVCCFSVHILHIAMEESVTNVVLRSFTTRCTSNVSNL